MMFSCGTSINLGSNYRFQTTESRLPMTCGDIVLEYYLNWHIENVTNFKVENIVYNLKKYFSKNKRPKRI